MTRPTSSSRTVYGWVRPLKDGGFQYFAKCPEGGYVWGAAPNRFGAAAAVFGFLADHGHEKVDIEQIKPYGKWANVAASSNQAGRPQETKP